MSVSKLSNATLAGLALAFTVVLGIGLWVAVEADDEPTAEPLAVAELETTDESVGEARVEIVRTGDSLWMKFQIRDMESDRGVLIVEVDGEPDLELKVSGSGDYSLAEDSELQLDEISYGDAVRFLQSGMTVLVGTVTPPD